MFEFGFNLSNLHTGYHNHYHRGYIRTNEPHPDLFPVTRTKSPGSPPEASMAENHEKWWISLEKIGGMRYRYTLRENFT